MKPQFDELRLTGNLPTPSGVGMKILTLTQNEDFSAEDLARTIQSDPALTGRVIKLANSAQSGGVKKITSVSEAVVRLGASAVRNLSLGFSLISSYRTGRCQSFDFGRFWSESLARAIAAQTLARELKLAPPADGYVCGLLAEVGKLALATVHAQAYSDLLARVGANGDRALATAEREAFSIDHREVAVAMLEDWRLPDAHRKAIAIWHQLDGHEPTGIAAKLARTLRLAAGIARIVASPRSEHGPLFEALESQRAEAGVPAGRLFALADAAAAEWTEWSGNLALPTQKVPRFDELHGLALQLAASAPAPVPTAAVVADPGDAARASADQLAAWDREDLDRDKIIVLAVEDEAVSRRVLVMHLRKAGYNVREAKDGREAQALALEINPHIIVTDWMMPELDGVQLTRNLRKTEIGREMYMLILTGREDEEQIVTAFDAGADDYVVKPFNPRVLLARVSAGERMVRLQNRVARDRKRMIDQMAEMAVLNRKLKQTSVTDSLTNIPNRRFAMHLLEELWNRRAPQPNRLATIMIDIDHFKAVNDGFGHDIGDAVLKEVATVLARNLRGSDTICRLGGEEFLVICPGADVKAGAQIAERLRSAVASHLISAGAFRKSVTISLGVAERAGTMRSHEDLLKAADVAVYRSKHDGRNRVTLALAS